MKPGKKLAVFLVLLALPIVGCKEGDEDAEQVQTTTPNVGSNQHANWSPDGSKIAFASTRDDDWEIYVMDSDGSNQTRLTRSPGRDAHPFWSPDGSQIVFQSPRGNESSSEVDLFVMNADGSNPTRITTNPGF